MILRVAYLLVIFLYAAYSYPQEGKINFADSVSYYSDYADEHFSKRDFTNALKFYKKALQFAEDKKLSDKEPLLFVKLGRSYVALNYLSKAISFYEECYNHPKKTEENVGWLLEGSQIYRKLSKYESAFALCKQAEMLCNSYRSELNCARVDLEIAMNLTAINKNSEALRYTKKALKVFQQKKSSNDAAEAAFATAKIIENLGNKEQAIFYYTEALDNYLNIGNVTILPSISLKLGELYTDERRYAEALKYLYDGLLKVQINNNRVVKKNIFKAVSEVYDKANEKEKSLEFYQKYKELNDSLDAEKAQQLMNEIDILNEKRKVEKTLGNEIQKQRTLVSKIEKEKDHIETEFELSEQRLLDSIFFKDQQLTEAEKIRKLLIENAKAEKREKEQKIKLLEQEKSLINSEMLRKQSEADFQKKLRNGLIALMILLIIGVGLLFFLFKERKAREKIAMEKQLVDLEQQALRLQMNPHFLFNSLNAIRDYISADDALSAKKYLAKFSKLMRHTLNSSRTTWIVLDEEVQYLNAYMELTIMLLDNDISFRIELLDNDYSEEIMVPTMLIQPFIENAIFHGLAPKDGAGDISLTIALKKNLLACTIKDTGIGRKAAGELKQHKQNTHQSLAMQITEDRLKVINNNGYTGNFTIKDVYDDAGVAAGTTVHLEISFREV